MDSHALDAVGVSKLSKGLAAWQWRRRVGRAILLRLPPEAGHV